MSQQFFYESQLVKLSKALEFNNVGLQGWCDLLTDELVAQHGTELMFIYDDVVNIGTLIVDMFLTAGNLEPGAQLVADVVGRINDRLMNSYGFSRPDIVAAFTPV